MMKTMPDFLTPSSSISRKQIIAAADGYSPLIATWLLELTLSLGWYKKSNSRRRWIVEDDSFARITGISVNLNSTNDVELADKLVINGNPVKHSDADFCDFLKTQLANFRKQSLRDDLYLFKNISLLGQLIGLNKAEKAILCFTTVLNVFHDFKSALSCVNHKASLQEVGVIIAHLSGQSEKDVIAGLRQDSTLRSAGIIEVGGHHSGDIEDRLELLSGMDSLLTQQHENQEVLIHRFLSRASEPNLKMQNFPHLAKDAATLKRYLESALRKRVHGTNILLYGIPGTGKTEFVKALSEELGTNLYEISFSDEDGDPITGTSRLRAYNLCQRILTQKENALLMFDEIEDVFPSQGGLRSLFGIQSDEDDEKSSKAWVNRTLESNATPAIWITNNAHIDPAYLRRFDYSIRFPVPPQKVRMEIARHHLGKFNPTETWLAKIAANEQMTPAQYERAAKVASISSNGDAEHAQSLVEQALDRSATLLGQKRTPARNTLHTGYDLRFANTGMAMPGVINGLKKNRQGTFCFYGPAGTGKSELARHIADELDMPCVVRRASDILSMWVGGSEQNIAEMFAEARQQEAVLVLDEADSFLGDRRDARHSWEVTQVNELLTQMEAFNGIFICTTNLMDKLDQASLRRFAFKVKFDYLTEDQCWEMFTQEYGRLGGDFDLVADWEKPVRNFTKLTPGDFAVAARQLSILDEPVTAGGFYRQLMEECRVKGGATGKIGFMG
jgi:SpoVK/Ycf46/Vps4 family AAA+-type ATPase